MDASSLTFRPLYPVKLFTEKEMGWAPEYSGALKFRPLCPVELFTEKETEWTPIFRGLVVRRKILPSLPEFQFRQYRLYVVSNISY
jgi:hypothetical protein